MTHNTDVSRADNASFAHSLPDQPKELWERLEEHLHAVADLARDLAERFRSGESAHLAGLWHDLGKYRPEFQERIRGKCIHAPHASAGASLAFQRAPRDGLPLAFVIAGHHTGLANLKSSVTGPTPLMSLVKDASQITKQVVSLADESIASTSIPSLPSWLVERIQADDAKCSSPDQGIRTLSFFTRMLFSALVDADRIQTAAFYAHVEGRTPDHQTLQYDSLAELQTRLDSHIDQLAAASAANPSPVNQLRAEVLADCREAADQAPGLFSLTVPTGGGKTLAAMSFALRHAQTHGMERVIVVIPFTSIIRQNAERYRQAFGPDPNTLDDRNVLEHHSAIDEQKRLDENSEQELRRQLAAENWDAPIIVTTTVQFFESLFSNHPSRCRKLHRIAKSVVILDEVQTLPPALLQPILEALQQLADDYDCSIVLSTATPPALERSPFLPHGLRDVRPIISASKQLFENPASKRVTVEWRVDEVTPYEDLAGEIKGHQQVLAIVHRRQDARDLCELLPATDRFHLSAMMCPAHRIECIQEIEQRLCNNQPCRLISTQLIEAGVDVDFPVVYRALAGVDSLAQSAGRCDREGRRTEQAGTPAGRFIVFRAPTEPPPGTLRKAMQTTDTLLKLQDTEPELAGRLDIFNPDHGRTFFREFYARNRSLDDKQILTALSGLNFATAARDFQMISDQGMRPLVVPWKDGPERAARYAKAPSRATARALQPYIVQVNQRYFDAVVARGLFEVSDNSIGLPTSLCTPDWYSEEFGLQSDPESQIDPSVMIL